MYSQVQLDRIESGIDPELNIREKDAGYSRRPSSVFTELLPDGKKMTRSMLAVLGVIFALSNSKKNPDARCNLSYSKFEEKLRKSRSSVANAVKALKDAGYIDQDKSNPSHASYRFKKEPNGKGFIKTPLFLYHITFAIKGEAEPRYLTESEIDVLSLIYTHCSNKKGKGYFENSVRGIAAILNLSKTTVQKAITALLHANLIYRAQEGRGLNSYKRSRFTVNGSFFRATQKAQEKKLEAEAKAAEQKAPTRQQTAREADVDARIDRERFYATRRQEAEKRADYFNQKLMGDKKYAELYKARRALEKPIAAADVLHLPELKELRAKAKSLDVQLNRRKKAVMHEQGFTEEDLKPHYCCERCSDTGFLKDGRACTCYKGPPPGNRRPS